MPKRERKSVFDQRYGVSKKHGVTCQVWMLVDRETKGGCGYVSVSALEVVRSLCDEIAQLQTVVETLKALRKRDAKKYGRKK